MKIKINFLLSHPKKRKVSDLNLDKVFGFVLNLPVAWTLLGHINPLNYMGERKHWIAIRNIESVWYDLDSKLSRPRPIGDVSCSGICCTSGAMRTSGTNDAMSTIGTKGTRWLISKFSESNLLTPI